MSRLKSWFKINMIHFMVWISYMLYETLLSYMLFDFFVNPLIYLVHYIVSIILFYLHSNLVLPWAVKSGRRIFWRLPLILVFQIALYVICHYMATVLLFTFNIGVSPEDPKLDTIFFLRNTYRCILFMGFSTGYYYLKTYLSERKRTVALEKERLEKIIHQQQIEKELVNAQNAFLKAQINPHFLFNTLDFVYHKVNAQSAIAGEAVIKLAEMMRFAIDSDEMGALISLRNEIEQVENLLFLYQVRRTTDLNVHFAYSEEVKELRLIPLVILTLVENIFKHGDISNPDEIAYIDLDLADGKLHIQTRNMIKKYKVEDSNHSGLNNIKKRLSYAYGEQVEFQYHTIGQHFKVDISIPVELLRQRV